VRKSLEQVKYTPQFFNPILALVEPCPVMVAVPQGWWDPSRMRSLNLKEALGTYMKSYGKYLSVQHVTLLLFHVPLLLWDFVFSAL
jgi:hypothetical protein